MQPPSPRVDPPGQGPPVGAAGRARPRQGGRLLAAAVRADGVEPGRRRRRHLHRRQRPAPGAQPAGADLGGRGRPVHRQHLPPGLGAAGAGRRPVGVRGRGRRRHLPADRAALPGAARTSRPRSGRTSSATSRPRSTPSTSTRSTVQRFTPNTDLERRSTWPGAEPTIRNIRLWDPAPSLSGQTFEQLQRIRNYYGINDIDVDRYEIDGELTQVNIGARVDQRRRACPATRGRRGTSPTPTATGWCWRRRTPRSAASPTSWCGNVPPEIDPTLAEPGFELEPAPACTSARTSTATSSSAPTATRSTSRTRTTRRRPPRYDGDDGVPADSLLRRAAFALRFGDLNPLISDFMTDDSKVIYMRDVVDRVRGAGAVPRRRRRPVPGGRRRPDHVGGRPVHDHRRATRTRQRGRHRPAHERQRAQPRLQLRAQLGEGHGRRLRRHGHALRRRRRGPDHRGLRRGVPRPVHRRRRDARRAAGAPALPRGPVPGPDRRVRPLPPRAIPRRSSTQDDAWRVARDPGTAGADPTTPVTDEQGQLTGEQRAPRIAPTTSCCSCPRTRRARRRPRPRWC